MVIVDKMEFVAVCLFEAVLQGLVRPEVNLMAFTISPSLGDLVIYMGAAHGSLTLLDSSETEELSDPSVSGPAVNITGLPLPPPLLVLLLVSWMYLSRRTLAGPVSVSMATINSYQPWRDSWYVDEGVSVSTC